MLPKYLFCFATAALSVFATPTTPKSTKTTKTTAVATPTPVNNGGQFITQCVNVGLSVADCTDLLNIAALNGNSINIGGGGGSGSGMTPVNNGAQFFTKCANLGISVLDCAEVVSEDRKAHTCAGSFPCMRKDSDLDILSFRPTSLSSTVTTSPSTCRS